MYQTSLVFLALITILMNDALRSQSFVGPQIVPLCGLQIGVTQGEQRRVQVKGVYISGLEGQYLVTSNCPGRSTFIEFDLRTHRLWKELVRLSNRSNKKRGASGDGDPILVVFEGEFYGPQIPDPKLPEDIRKNYHPGWDPMNAAMTKMVVHAIRRVQPLPSDHPCAPRKSDPKEWPCFQNASPQYPRNP